MPPPGPPPPPPFVARLAPPDQWGQLQFINAFLTFETENTKKAIELLRTGLQKTVSQLPFLGGSVVTNQHGNYSGVSWKPESAEIQFECLDHSPFPATYVELKAENMPIHKYFAHALPTAAKVDCRTTPSVAALAVSYVELQGGLIVSFAANHSVVDGIGLAELVQQWSHNTAGLVPRSQIDPFEPMGRFQRIANALHGYEPVTNQYNPMCPEARVGAPPPPPGPPKFLPNMNTQTKIFALDSRKIRKLRETLVQTHCKGQASTNTVLIAVFWYILCLARARRLSSEEAAAETRLCTTVNFRKLVEREWNLPQPVIGNMVTNAEAKYNFAALAAAEREEAIAALVDAISTSIREITYDSIASATANTMNAVSTTFVRRLGDLFNGRNFITASWADLDFYADFGTDIGKPQFIRHTGTQFDGGIMVMPIDRSGPRKHTTDVIVSMVAEDMEMLEQHELLTSFLVGDS